MLQTIRDRAQGWLAYLVVGLISVPFALWGVHEYLGDSGIRLAANVDGLEIPVHAFQTELQQQRQRMASFFDGRIPPELIDDTQMRESAIKSLVRNALLDRMIDGEGYQISATAVAREISNYDIFRQNGTFDSARYTQVLQSQRMSPAAFEASVREGLRRGQFPQGIVNSTIIPRSMAEDVVRMRGQRREIEYAIFASKRVITPDENRLREYFETHRNDFRTEERVKLAYVELNERTLAAAISPSDDDLRRFFDEQRDDFSKSAEYRAGQIFFSYGVEANDAAIRLAKDRASKALERLDGGESFEIVARETSDDSFSRENGGDIGAVVKGDLDPALEQVLFSLTPGQVSGLVETTRGIYILRLLSMDVPVQPAFEEVRDQVERELSRRLAERQIHEAAERLANTAYENPSNLDAAAASIGTEIKITDWVTRQSGGGIAAVPRVREAAFSSQVLVERHNSDLLDLEDGRVLVVRVHEYEPPGLKSYEDVLPELRLAVIADQRREHARSEGERALSALRQGKSLSGVARETDASLVSPGLIERNASEVPSEIRQAAFAIGYPQNGQPIFGGVILPNGGYAVYVVSAVVAGDTDAAAVNSEVARLRTWYGQREMESLLDGLESEAKVEIFRENL